MRFYEKKFKTVKNVQQETSLTNPNQQNDCNQIKNSSVELLYECLIACMTTFESYGSSSENFLQLSG